MKPETKLMGAIFGLRIVGEELVGGNDEDYLESLDGKNLREVLFGLLDEISSDEKRIQYAPKFVARVKPLVRARFGFDGEPKTLKELGEMFGVTRERIRQQEAKILRMLRNPSRSRHLKPYLSRQ